VVLEFWNFQTMESRTGGCYDGGIVEVSSDGGTTWTQVAGSQMLSDPYDGQVSSSFQNPLAGLDAWCGDPQPFLNSIVDVTAYAGQTVQVRFRLGSDVSVSRTDGWNIDDVYVQSCQVDAGGLPFNDGFESGDTSAWSAVQP
jgi:lysyl endopeptidase